MTKKTKKNKDVTKEVLKDEEKWYGLEKKFWSVVEFGVYVVLLTFTAIAIGAHYQNLEGDKNVIIDDDTSKQMAIDTIEGVTYDINVICGDGCDEAFTDESNGKEIKYESSDNGTHLTVGTVTIDCNPLTKFAILSNDYIATVETSEGKGSLVKYYNSEGEEVHSYTTYLETTQNISSTKGVYGTCSIPENSRGNDQTLSIVEYEIEADGSFEEKVTGTFENVHCQD